MQRKLQILKGGGAGREYDLVEDEILLGRDSKCQIAIDDHMASRQHARLVLEDDTYVIEDLKSMNRTYVNGKQIGGKVRLKDKDQIQIGDTLFGFRSCLPSATGTESGRTMVVLNSIDARSSQDLAADVNAEAKLRAVLQIAQALGHTLDLEAVLSKMLDGLFEIFPHADRALVLLLDNDRLVPKAVKHRRGQQDRIEYSMTIVQRAMRDRQAILSEDAVGDERFSLAASIVDFQIRSVMCVPLLSQESNALGVIQLDAQGQQAKFSADDMHILTSVASQASISVEHAQLHKEMVKQAKLQKEMDFAQHVQQNFLPRATPELAGYSFWAYYLAAGKVGGDYYDFLPLPNGNHAALLADVSGKGVPAALMMAKASTVCKVALLSHPDNLSQAMNVINGEVCDASVDGAFVTLVLCVIDPKTHEIELANAGHMFPIFRRADGTIDEPANEDLRGYPLGIVRDFPYKTDSATLGPGDSVVLFSDGISEAMDSKGDLYSTERISQQLSSTIGKGPSEIGQTLLGDVRRHAAGHEQSDDISLVIFGRAPA